MNFRSLRFKIALWSALSLILLAAALTLYSVWTLQQQVEEQRRTTLSTSEQLLLDGAQARAKEVEESIMRALQTARVLAHTFGSMAGREADLPAVPDAASVAAETGVAPGSASIMDDAPKADGRRESVDRILQAVLRGHPDFLAVYTAWEPNAFDGRDADFVGARGTDASGRLIPYWSRAPDGALGLEPLLDYETPGDGDYYLLPKKTGTEHVLNPYVYPVQGRDVLLTSLVVPILVDGRFQGIAGVDLALDHLQGMIDETAKGLYEGAAGIALVAHDGTIVAASGRPELIGKPLSALHEDWQEDLKDIQNASPMVEEDEGNLMAVVPVRFGEDPMNWGIQLTLPMDWVMARVEEVASEGQRAIGTMVGLSVLCLVLGVALMMVVAGMVVRPIRRLSLALHDIAEGDGDLTHDLDDSAQDETGELARAFNVFQGKLRELIHQLADGGRQVASSADQLSVMSDRSAENVNRQHSETDQVATAMNEMTATVAEVSRHASQAAEATQQADQQADSGRAAVSRSVEAMQTLSQQVQSASEAIARVSNDATEITSILDVIGGIADQTNLLALNAAIEAARAGEQGRGFAVVADEVRTLAGRTQNSTREIQEMIERLQSGTRGAVEVMDAGQDRARDSLDAVAEAADAIETMARSVASVKDMNMQIASAAEEQTAVAEEIDRNLVTIVQLVEQVSNGATESNQAAQRLKQLATEQNARLGRFKV
ncbi:methyl-accepting chemotaxis protein [Imhoffiella purpurea]|uniref:Methyl-accepting chemotaxis protein n=1 Tax=Imhoffiella purpurea TaxID=1249627 RepID=W9V5V5_9GAMM|nr:methyl-accepting chemotaxis protein [Imhoffiella purpurea]EXJ14749.1 Methyl-accepting chemotaxis protein [Imhoffiella purpurea]